MGRIKSYIAEQDALGFSARSTFVCTGCIEDKALKQFIKQNGNKENECSYCVNQRKRQTISFNDFMEFFIRGLNSEWSDPNNEGVAWEHGWAGKVLDSYDLVTYEINVGFSSKELLNHIRDSLVDRQWCQRNFYQLTPQQALIAGWQEFVNVVKHKARYVFFRLEDDRSGMHGVEEIPPTYFLDELGSIISGCKLYTRLPINTEILRMRFHSEEIELTKASELGAPPAEFAIFPNRMSAGGISAFYGAFDEKTLLAESRNQGDEYKTGTIGTFETRRELLLVDFTTLPEFPSMFKPKSREIRAGLIFIKNFIKDLTSPIKKDGREHIEYVPTQVVAEYLRFIYKNKDNEKIDGIIYESARNPGSNACVLFIENENASDVDNESEATILVMKKPPLRIEIED